MSMRRDTTNWVMELEPIEGDKVLEYLKTHQHANGRNAYDHTCDLCRAMSRISLGRDYPLRSALRPETIKEINSSGVCKK